MRFYKIFYSDLRATLGGRSSGNSGSDNENPNGAPVPQEDIRYPKELNSLENLHKGFHESHIPEPMYGEKLPFLFQGETEPDLPLSSRMYLH